MSALKQQLVCICIFLALALPVIAQQETIPFKQDSVTAETVVLRTILLLIVVTAIAYGVVYFLKRQYHGGLLSKSLDAKISILETKKISLNLNIYRLKINSREIVLAQSGTNLLVLDQSETQESEK